ncbi:hypothetical protein [Elioraea sp.]|uniref:hypothetical protein n=1 Tax=Elioraea sp. TaxID=2185103 RepID=UPI0025BF3765|nr:hypothetical protein [Elioraea sp.]
MTATAQPRPAAQAPPTQSQPAQGQPAQGQPAQPQAAQAPAQAQPASPPANDAATAEQPAAIEGFRSARFGMNEQELRAAIRRDFAQAAERIVSEQTPVERTQVLTVTVPDLIPDAGTARISYILGHRSRRLIQVTILWGPPADAAARPEALVNAAEALRAHFGSLAWRAGSVAGGVALTDGSTLIFRGLDAQGRMAQLQALPAAAPAGAATATARPFGLRLAYVADPTNPDVFRLQRGQF